MSRPPKRKRPIPPQEERPLTEKLNCIRNLVYTDVVVNAVWWLALGFLIYLVIGGLS